MSTNKTEHYGLHSWEPEDDFLRSEINENFAKLDGAQRAVVIGSYQGDGTTARIIDLGFTPAAVLLENDRGMRYYEHMTATGGFALVDSPTKGGYSALTVVEGGFQVGATYSGNCGTNGNNTSYYYIAFRE